MEISLEEKKAVERIKQAIEEDKKYRIETIYDESPLFRDNLQIILNLIEKQSKEIERQKEINKEHQEENGKLRQEIKELTEKVEKYRSDWE